MKPAERKKRNKKSSEPKEQPKEPLKSSEEDTPSPKLFCPQDVLPPETTKLTLHTATTNQQNLPAPILMLLMMMAAWVLFDVNVVENSTATAEKSKKG